MCFSIGIRITKCHWRSPYLPRFSYGSERWMDRTTSKRRPRRPQTVSPNFYTNIAFFRVVQPVVDLIKGDSFQYTQVTISKGGFDVALRFKWEFFDWSYFNVPENNVKLFE